MNKRLISILLIGSVLGMSYLVFMGAYFATSEPHFCGFVTKSNHMPCSGRHHRIKV